MKRLLFLGTFADKSYLPRLKPLVTNAVTSLRLDDFTVWTECKLYCIQKGITGIISTSPKFLKQVLGITAKEKATIDNYAGSFFKKDGIEIVFINPLDQLITVPYGSFLTARYISKLTHPENWNDCPEFSFSILNTSNIEDAYDKISQAYAVAVDIETLKTNLLIRCIGFTAIITVGGSITTHSFVIKLDSEWALAWARKFVASPPRKIFQNGKYDLAYLARYGIITYNYLYDTAAMMHCWYSELPKDLASLQAFCVREASYWKDLADTGNEYEYFMYNAKDTWATALSWYYMIGAMPQWAIGNYLQEFPVQFPCHLAEMTGIQQSQDIRKSQEAAISTKIEFAVKKLNDSIGKVGFNSNSHVQVKSLMRVLGCGDIADKSSDEKSIKACQFRHPLNAHILELILDIRGLRKLNSTYLGEDKNYRGVILYSLNPHGTDTGRLASKEHHFWCGLNIQNTPRGKDVKCTLVPAKGFRLAEVDLEQAESRDTAYIAGDEALIAAVSGSRDFHSVNASAFFGRDYKSIYDDESKKTLDKKLRDLAKRVNHGANYLMGPDVLVDTMGLKNIFSAATMLKLPAFWTPKQTAEYLLEQFHKTYPFLSKVFYPSVIAEVKATHMLQSKATHECNYLATNTGWTRYCFKNPEKNKRDKNAYVAHVPQSLNAMTLNKAFVSIFYDIAINPKYRQFFRLHAQIHDSILFSFAEGHEYLAELVRERMEIPVTVKSCDGNIRTFIVPAAIKAGKDGKGALSWSETE